MAGELVCSRCGTVIEDKAVSTKPTHRMLLDSSGGVGPRVTELLHDHGVGTINAGRLSSAEERLLSRVLSEVIWVGDKIGVPKAVAERAGELARKAVAAKLVKRARKATAAAIVYIAINHHGLCRTVEEIAATMDVPVHQLNKEIGKIVFGLKIKVNPLDTAIFIERIAKMLELGSDITEAACRIYTSSAVGSRLSGRKPSAISAAALYIACRMKGKKVTLTQLAETGGISVLTLRKTINLLETVLGANGKQG